MHVLFLCCFWLEKIQQNEKKNDSELKGMFVRASRNLSRPGFPSSADWPDGSNVAWNRKLILQSSTIRAHEAINLMETWEGGGVREAERWAAFKNDRFPTPADSIVWYRFTMWKQVLIVALCTSLALAAISKSHFYAPSFNAPWVGEMELDVWISLISISP